MKVELRQCKKCGRKTIQAFTKKWSCTRFVVLSYVDQYIWGWYCPNCGTFWVKEEEEVSK